MNNVGLYALTVLIWGSAWIGLTFQLGVVPPEVSIVYRYVLAAALMFGWCLVRRLNLVFTWRQHAWIAAQGFTMFSLSYIFYYFAVAHLPSGIVAVAHTAVIPLNIVLAALVLRTRIGARVLLGSALGALGILLVFRPELARFNESAGALDGLAYALIATSFSAVSHIISALNQRRGLPVFETSAWALLYGGALTAAIALVRDLPFVFDWRPGYIVSLLFLSIFSTVLAFHFYLTLLGRLGPERMAYSSVLYPLVALFWSTLLEDYRWSLAAIAGLALVLVGNAFVLAPRASAAAAPRQLDPRQDHRPADRLPHR